MAALRCAALKAQGGYMGLELICVLLKGLALALGHWAAEGSRGFVLLRKTSNFFFFSKGMTVFYLKPRDGLTEESVVSHKDTG